MGKDTDDIAEEKNAAGRGKPEILAPAGDFTCLQAALDAGADAVYFGLDAFNMRVSSGVNFKPADLPEISRRCRAAGVKSYLTLNSIMFESEADAVEKTIADAKPHVDAFIVSDWGVVELCKKHSVPFHISTQMSTSNSAAVQFLLAQGASRIVLARECTLAEVAAIVSKTGAEIECFVHGAQCVAESGRCLMSHEAFGHSACRGECRQPCRRRFKIQAVDLYEDENGNPVHESETAFEIGPRTVLSAKDLCSIRFIDRLVAAGIASFKIEGRARNANYVKTCVECYREAVDEVFAGTYSQESAGRLEEKLKTVFHREFSPGLFHGRPGADQFTDSEDSLATTVKRHVGVIVNYYAKAGIAEAVVQDRELSTGDEIQIHGPTTGVVELVAGELRLDDMTVATAHRGDDVTFAAPRCRTGDKVFFIEHRDTNGK